MTVLATKSALLGDVVKWEEEANYSRDNGVAGAGGVLAGEAVIGTLGALVSMTADTDAVIGIACGDAASGESVAVLTREAQVGDKAIIIGGTGTIAKVTTDLAALGIIVREQATDYSF